MEHLHDVNRCRARCATHYQEMTALAGKLPGVENATVTVKEWDGDVIFLHEVGPGAADRSYGIQVARLAGLPAAVVARARDVLNELYGRLERSLPVDSGDVEAAILMAADSATDGVPGPVASGQPALIRTRRKTIVARTPAQVVQQQRRQFLGGRGQACVGRCGGICHACVRKRLGWARP